MNRKEYIKQKAEAMAKLFGFNVDKPNLTDISALEMYCLGYAQAMEDAKEDVAFLPEGINEDHSAYNDTHPDYIRGNEDGI